jgi:hypothetical protein
VLRTWYSHTLAAACSYSDKIIPSVSYFELISWVYSEFTE